MNISIKLKTKKKITRKKYLNLFKKIISNYKWMMLDLKIRRKTTSTYFFSILKSPFVYKTSQEHIGYNIYKAFLNIFLINKFTFFVFFKKLLKVLLQDTANTLLLTTSIYTKQIQKIQLLRIKNYCIVEKINVNYLKILDVLGEKLLEKKIRLSSSVGRAMD